MENKKDFKTWGALKKELTYMSEREKEVITQMAHMINDIVRRRKQLGLTQREVAERSGITQPQVARLETSASVPSMETVMKVAIALGLTIKLDETNEQTAELERKLASV